MVDNDSITNFLNSLAYHTDFDGIDLEDITLESCTFELQEMKKHADPDDIELLNSITPAMLHDEYVFLWHEQHKKQEKPRNGQVEIIAMDNAINSALRAAEAIIDVVSVNHAAMDNEYMFQFMNSIHFSIQHAMSICHEQNRDTQYDKLAAMNDKLRKLY